MHLEGSDDEDVDDGSSSKSSEYGGDGSENGDEEVGSESEGDEDSSGRPESSWNGDDLEGSESDESKDFRLMGKLFCDLFMGIDQFSHQGKEKAKGKAVYREGSGSGSEGPAGSESHEPSIWVTL